MCKETFREIKQKVKDVNVTHHFLHRRKAGGKCTKCDRGFGNWRKFTGRVRGCVHVFQLKDYCCCEYVWCF